MNYKKLKKQLKTSSSEDLNNKGLIEINNLLHSSGLLSEKELITSIKDFLCKNINIKHDH